MGVVSIRLVHETRPGLYNGSRVIMTVRFNKNGKRHINHGIFKDWVVKSPTVKHRLGRLGSGTIGLTMAERFDLKSKKGIMYVDTKHYVCIPIEILSKYEPERCDYGGVKGSIIVYNIRQIVEENQLELQPIPTEGDNYQAPGIAGEVRKKFGL